MQPSNSNEPTLLPFNRSSTAGKELQYIAETMLVGQIAGDQTFTRRCQKLIESLLPGSRVFLTTSCTHALEMTGLLLDLKPGDEVLVPSFAFVSTANAFALRGATPVFVDVHPDTMNFDERDAARKITPRTRAMAPIHYAGVGCAMDELMELARKHEITVIEDNAHGFLGEYGGRRLGTIGPMGALSFHETKNFTCGEGGALIVNDPKYVERAEILREKGTNRSRFFRGQVDKYTWVDIGSSYVVSDVLAAFLYGQLEQWRGIQEKRGRVWNRYW
ncbi:MAG: dTDP-4-amino-4,6-dideoxygalactose transaminase, partial [Planctomycetia bacterium]